MEVIENIQHIPDGNHTHAKATLCVVNYKTLDFTRLCLRSIRKFTRYPHRVVVVDNDSKDESVEYLRSLDWIELIERKNCNDCNGGTAHGRALDLAFERCETEYFMSLHSDTFLLQDGWLSHLMSYFDNDPSVTCVGSGKLELRPEWQLWLKRVTDIKAHMRRFRGTHGKHDKYRYYNRTICCGYRTESLRKEGLSFIMNMAKEMAPGKELYFELVDRGRKTVEMPVKEMGRYVVHLAHATEPVVVRDLTRRKRTVRKFKRRLNEVWKHDVIQDILADSSLDK